MELEIRITYIGAYHTYRLSTYGKKGGMKVTGFGFLIDTEFPLSAIKFIKNFRVFPTIREALMDACCSWIDNDSLYQIDEKIDYFEINGNRLNPEDVPRILNFI